MSLSKFQPSPNIREPISDGQGLLRQRWFQWFTILLNGLNAIVLSLNAQVGPYNKTGFSGTIVTANLTVGGTNGSMTFKNGVLTSEVAAT